MGARSTSLTGFRAACLALFCGLAALFSSCDNPACAFGGDCSGSGQGPVETNPAQRPAAGQLILNGAPVLESIIPAAGVVLEPTSPIVLVFSESMQTSGLNSAFTVLGGTFGGTVGLQVPAVLGDGRVVVLRPTAPYMAGSFQLAISPGGVLTDLTGQEYAQPADGVLLNFSVTAAPTDTPSVIATFPGDGESGVPTTTEVVVVFDREMSAASVDDDSFIVMVDSMDPVTDPLPVPLFAGTAGVDTSVWIWRPLDGSGNPASLGAGLTVEIELSPSMNQIVAQDAPGLALPNTVFDFTTAVIDPPGVSSVISIPDDAIGADALVNGTLMINVDLADGQVDDVLTAFIFGGSPVENSSDLAVLQRDVVLTSAGTFVVLVPADLGLLSSVSPPTGRLADGDLRFAFRYQRGNEISALTLLDINAALDGVQDPLQDLVAPVFVGFGSAGSQGTNLRSMTRDLVVSGLASERLRAADVVAMPSGGDVNNGAFPVAIAGSGADGAFIAAPVGLGLVDRSELPLPFSMTIYDVAFNSTVVTGLVFNQTGASGPAEGTVAVGEVRIEVFDAASGAALQSALVLTHQDDGGAITAVPMGSGTTDVNGRVDLPAAAVGETIVTVVLSGFDLFTFHGVPTNFLQVPLQPSPNSGTVNGTLFAPDTALNSFSRQLHDSRVALDGSSFVTVGSCSSGPFGGSATCTIPDATVEAGQIGVTSFLALDIPASELAYAPTTFLRGFFWQLPTVAVSSGETQSLMLEFEFLLDDPLTDPELRAIDVPAFALPESASGIDFSMLASDPLVRIEGVTPGLRHAFTVGSGVAFDMTGSWDVRSAFAGAADGVSSGSGDLLGELVTAGSIEADLLVRAEFVDTSGNRSARRSRLSVLPGSVVTADVPTLAFPTATGPGTLSFNAAFANSITDAGGLPGIYRLTLTDGNGRRWTLWRSDPTDAAGPNVVVHVADLAAAAAVGLATGTVSASVEAFGVPAGFDPALFLWTDVERDYETYGRSITQFPYPN